MAVKGYYFCDVCSLMESVSRARRSLFGKCVLENNPFKSISNSRTKSFSSTYVAFNGVNKFYLVAVKLTETRDTNECTKGRKSFRV